MMTQSVMTQAANLFGNATGSVTLKGKQTGNGFDLIIGSSMKAQQNTAVNNTAADGKKTSVQTTESASSVQGDGTGSVEQKDQLRNQLKDQFKSQEAGKSSDTGNQAQKVQNGKALAVKEEETKADAKDTPVIDDQLLAQISGLLQNLSNAVMQKLGMTPEEFQKLLGEQGMTAADLLNPENLQKFILANSKETNILAALTNEDLAGTMKDLLKLVEDMKSEAGLQLTADEMKELLSKTEKAGEILSAKVSEPENTDVLGQQAEVMTGKQTELKDATSAGSVEKPVTANKDENTFAGKNESQKNTAADKPFTVDTSKTESFDTGNSGTQNSADKDNGMDLASQDRFQLFIDNMVKASKETILDFNNTFVQTADIREIAQQIIEHIRISITPDQSSMELQLNPENLGKVNLTVQSKDGAMTAQFVVQNEVSKEAIESQIATLKETLNQQGIKVDAIEVTVSANAFEQSGREGSQSQEETSKNSSGRQITLEEAINMTELPEEEGTLTDITGTLGSQIDYTA